MEGLQWLDGRISDQGIPFWCLEYRRGPLTQPIQLATPPADGVQITANATGNLNMHGVTKSVTFPVTARRSAATIQVTGSIPITFADYSISNPSGGPATTGDSGTMEFLINFAH